MTTGDILLSLLCFLPYAAAVFLLIHDHQSPKGTLIAFYSIPALLILLGILDVFGSWAILSGLLGLTFLGLRHEIVSEPGPPLIIGLLCGFATPFFLFSQLTAPQTLESVASIERIPPFVRSDDQSPVTLKLADSTSAVCNVRADIAQLLVEGRTYLVRGSILSQGPVGVILDQCRFLPHPAP